MDTTYKASYPCKIIASFWDNYYSKDIYEKIKKITLRKYIPQDNEDILMYNFFLLFALLFTLPTEYSFSDIKRHYEYVFSEKLDNDLYDLFLLRGKTSDIFEWLNECFELILTSNPKKAFLIFLLATLEINKIFGYSCVIPTTMLKNISKIKGRKVRTYFINGYLNNIFRRKIENLKKYFIDYVIKNKKRYIAKGILHIFLFGSVLTGDYHASSDFDLVIEYDSKIDIFAIRDINKKIKNDLFKKFGRSSDIHILNNFIKISEIGEFYKIF